MTKLRWILLAMLIPTAAYAAFEAVASDDCPPTPDCPCAH
jgi:hypothetical protein